LDPRVDPDGAHDPATQVREEAVAFFSERTDRVDHDRRLQLQLSSLILLVMVIAQLIGKDFIFTEEIDNAIIISVVSSSVTSSLMYTPRPRMGM
jgi:hypothetical protein